MDPDSYHHASSSGKQIGQLPQKQHYSVYAGIDPPTRSCPHNAAKNTYGTPGGVSQNENRFSHGMYAPQAVTSDIHGLDRPPYVFGEYGNLFEEGDKASIARYPISEGYEPDDIEYVQGAPSVPVRKRTLKINVVALALIILTGYLALSYWGRSVDEGVNWLFGDKNGLSTSSILVTAVLFSSILFTAIVISGVPLGDITSVL